MPNIYSSLSEPYRHIDSTETFISTYISANTTEKELLFASAKCILAATIKTPDQFGQLISHLEDSHISELYHATVTANAFFLKNAGEFAHVCIYLDDNRIKIFCNLMEQRFDTNNFIDNAAEFRTIFSSFQAKDGKTNMRLTASQIKIIYNILKPKLHTPFFFRTLDDFVKLFCLLPEIQDKKEAFQLVENQLDQLIISENNINHIHQNLTTTSNNELELFKEVREKIYRSFIKDHTRSDKAFHAMLFLILDNYPGNQPDRLKSIIDTVFLNQPTELNALLEKTENAMRFLEFNITSTRLKNAIGYLIKNFRENKNAIEADHIIQLAKSKIPTMSLFPEKLVESEVKETTAFQPQF